MEKMKKTIAIVLSYGFLERVLRVGCPRTRFFRTKWLAWLFYVRFSNFIRIWLYASYLGSYDIPL